MASRGALLVATNCSEPAREEEYRRWYLGTHIPDVLEVPPISQHGNVKEIAAKFGGTDKLVDAINKLQELLYAA